MIPAQIRNVNGGTESRGSGNNKTGLTVVAAPICSNAISEGISRGCRRVSPAQFLLDFAEASYVYTNTVTHERK